MLVLTKLIHIKALRECCTIKQNSCKEKKQSFCFVVCCREIATQMLLYGLSRTITSRLSALKADLDSKLIGQHIASSIIQDAVTGFMRDNNPRKPLVLSLHGPSGTGKNFVSKLIAENIYKKGMDSSFVHVFTSQLHFPHSGLVDTYKSQLKQWIKANVISCERSMFIFDEIDKMPPGLFDSITPYLDYYVKLDGVSYRKAIFIFLSNDGGEDIKETALQFWREGRDREEIELKDLETAIAKSALKYNTSGFWHSDLIEKNMIDFFVPFLPLEYRHVVQCAMAEMKANGHIPEQAVSDKVARDLDYFPKFERAFSTRGFSVQGDTFGPFGETATAIASLWRKIFHSQENCDSEWISFNAEGLKADLDSKLIGQHIASSIIQDAVTGFMRDNNPRKPLVLSLHGPSGTGKNFVSKLIAENIYKKGMDSSFVHVFTSQLHFPHSGLVDTYKSQLKQWIKGNVSNCERSMFIFDGMENMPPGLLFSIMPYLDYLAKVDGVSYRKAIFMFLSNDGGETIKETALKFWREGRNREEIELKDIGGFWYSDLICYNMINFFIPFLPLEYRHVVQCAMAEMKANGHIPEQAVLDKVARDMDYFPKFERAFSTRGFSVQGDTFGPFGETATAIASLWRKIFHSQENCDSEWISFKAEALKADLDSKLIGQHIASSIIQDAVTGFMRDNNPRKPLVLSLHGPSGTGKNFVSKLIAENIYKKGMDSSFVHVFTSQLHFPHSGLVDTYKSQLKQWIKGNVSNCERSMFIFDGMNMMPPGLVDVMMQYLDHRVREDGVAYWKAIFIFVSIAGGEMITKTVFNYWREGKDQEEIELKDLETAMSTSVLNTNSSSFRYSSLTENMIDFFILFLPLEYRHVIQCAKAEIENQGGQLDWDVVDKMAGDLDYFPRLEKVFSVRGCKTIEKRLKFYV
ncbi:hypothetical protein Q5P01_024304 [Channa striata]|uniref:AAA+ ATPase domain-containing protein n=1 Tax=Channa striata TaxID=64152 RepID=A0AA88LQA6_CHASR|nr:hypothetical protein Q5P01_024304 [Channa striata]